MHRVTVNSADAQSPDTMPSTTQPLIAVGKQNPSGQKLYWMLLAVILTLLIAWIDYITEWEVSLFVLYSIPIAIAAWWCGNTAGILIALLSSLLWFAANVGFSPYKTYWGTASATGSRWLYFFIIAFTVSLTRKKQKADQKLIQLLKDRNQLERDLSTISEYEKNRLGRELHDGLCQQLAAISCATQILSREFEQHENNHKRDLELIDSSLKSALQEARALASNINPIYLEEAGLAEAIRQFVQSAYLLSRVRIDTVGLKDIQHLNKETSLHLYRIAQEAISNALRHANCSKITISMNIRDGILNLQIRDDGIGIPSDALINFRGMGIRSMRYRASSAGGRLDITRVPGGGTDVAISLPLDHEKPDTQNLALP